MEFDYYRIGCFDAEMEQLRCFGGCFLSEKIRNLFQIPEKKLDSGGSRILRQILHNDRSRLFCDTKTLTSFILYQIISKNKNEITTIVFCKINIEVLKLPKKRPSKN